MAARRQATDPQADLDKLKASIAKDGLARGYLLKGDELFFQDRGIDAIVAAAKGAGLEYCRHDLNDPDFQAGALLDDLGALPMFGTGRCVVVRNPAALLKKVAGEDSPFTRAVLADLADASRTGTIVIAGSGLRVDHAVAKAILDAGGRSVDCSGLKDLSREFNDPRRGGLVRWVENRAREIGLKISNDDAYFLASATGNDLSGLDGELRGLLASGDNVRDGVLWEEGGTPWQVADELLSGDPGRALAGIEPLFRSGFQQKDGRSERSSSALATMILGTLRTKVRQGFTIAQGMSTGLNFGAAAELAGLSGRWQLNQVEPLMRGRDVRAWARMLEDVGDFERAVRSKSGVDENDFARLALRWRREPERAGRRR